MASSRTAVGQTNRSSQTNCTRDQQSRQSGQPITGPLAAGYRPYPKHPSGVLTFGEFLLEVVLSEPSESNKLCTATTINSPNPYDRFKSIVSAIDEVDESPQSPDQLDKRDAWFVEDWIQGRRARGDEQTPKRDRREAAVEHLINTYRNDLYGTVCPNPSIGPICLLPSLGSHVNSVRDDHNTRLTIPECEVAKVGLETLRQCAVIARQAVEDSMWSVYM